ncbi:MAG: ACT domain-containing protein, partial [Pseudomonadota bacterium]
FEGPGAGGDATASAVLADVIDVAAGRGGPPFGVAGDAVSGAHRADADTLSRSWYLRVLARDEPGVVAAIAVALRDQGVSIASMIQRGRGADGAAVPVAFILHEAALGAVRRATAQLGEAAGLLGAPQLMPIEPVA